MKLRVLSIILILGCFLLAFQQMEKQVVSKNINEVNSNISLQTNNDLNFYLPTSTTSQIVKHTYYSLSYNEKAEQAEWVAYKLKKENITHNTFKRPYFIEDPKVNTKSADWKNYKKSVYDKGHLCPAADMKFDKNAYDDTFYTSNISPQKHEFNAGIWNRIEQKIRFWAVKNEGLIIITGGVLKGICKTIGTEKVVVPDYFYKIALSPSKGKYKIIAFLVPNEKSSKSIFDYVVAVDQIESITGIDFFPKLEDTLENSLEKKVDISSWLSK